MIKKVNSLNLLKITSEKRWNKESHKLQAEVSCKSIFRKSLSLIKIENCLKGGCFIQGS